MSNLVKGDYVLVILPSYVAGTTFSSKGEIAKIMNIVTPYFFNYIIKLNKNNRVFCVGSEDITTKFSIDIQKILKLLYE